MPCRSYRDGTNELGAEYIGTHKARNQAAHAMWRRITATLHVQTCELCEQPLGRPRPLHDKQHVCGEVLGMYDKLTRYDHPIDEPEASGRVAAVVITLGQLRGKVDPKSDAARLVEQLVGLLEIEELPPEV